MAAGLPPLVAKAARSHTQALRRQSAELARLAAQRYAPSLGGRDPSLQALLDRALAAQLGVQPGGGGGPLAGLLGQLLAG